MNIIKQHFIAQQTANQMQKMSLKELEGSK